MRQTQDFATNVCRAWPVHIECILDDIRCSQNDAGEQERIGYKVELKGPGALTLDGFFALMGCFQPLNSTDRGCGPSVTYVHINVDVWTEGYAENWVQIQANYPNKAPKPKGSHPVLVLADPAHRGRPADSSYKEKRLYNFLGRLLEHQRQGPTATHLWGRTQCFVSVLYF